MQRQLESKECEGELRLLLREADVASDWKVDPVLKQACQEVVTNACDKSLGSTHVMMCLMGLVQKQSRHMTSNCQARFVKNILISFKIRVIPFSFIFLTF